MPKITLVTYADQNYIKRQLELNEVARQSGAFDEFVGYAQGWISKQSFYEKNRELLLEKRGNGFWAWKPYVMLHTLESPWCEENDIVVYVDCGDALQNLNEFKEFVVEKMATLDVLLTRGAFPNKDWTKRDCFFYLDCDSQEYWNAIQVEAGIIVAKKTVRTMMLLREWQQYCLDRRIISDDENVCGLQNLPGFKDHRHDQSILSLLSVRRQIHTDDSMRRFVTCNANQSE